MGNTANKICGAIQWVDYPFHFSIGIATGTTFLTDKTVIGVGFVNMVNDGLFRATIHFGDKVMATLLINLH